MSFECWPGSLCQDRPGDGADCVAGAVSVADAGTDAAPAGARSDSAD
jgi:hypothetical protein